MTEKATGDILLVEDNDLDVILTRQCFEHIAPEIKIHRVPDGLQAMAFLRNEETHADAPTPDLVLLDLNLPVMSGQEVMSEIVRDEELKFLPVIILTNSSSSDDVMRSIDCGRVRTSVSQSISRSSRTSSAGWCSTGSKSSCCRAS